MSIWVTSDWHFGHDREFIWKARGFDSVEQMNEWIIYHHNKLVQPDDDVYVLGDLMLGDLETGLACVKRLNGKLHVVRGNHDTDKRWEAYIEELPNIVQLQNAIYLKYRKHHFYMSHYPSLTGNLEKESLKQMTLNLYGHTHQKSNFYMDMPYMYHVGVDSHDCKPALLDDVIKEMYEKVEECKEFLDLDEEETQEKSVEMGQEEGNRPNISETESECSERRAFKTRYCDRCVRYLSNCSGPERTRVGTYSCSGPLTYKRDPPDGGYYG